MVGAMRTPEDAARAAEEAQRALLGALPIAVTRSPTIAPTALPAALTDRKSTRLNSSH